MYLESLDKFIVFFLKIVALLVLERNIFSFQNQIGSF